MHTMTLAQVSQKVRRDLRERIQPAKHHIYIYGSYYRAHRKAVGRDLSGASQNFLAPGELKRKGRHENRLVVLENCRRL